MTLAELTKELRESSQSWTKEERLELLQKAHILDQDGFFCADYFSEETVRKDKERRQKQNPSSI